MCAVLNTNRPTRASGTRWYTRSGVGSILKSVGAIYLVVAALGATIVGISMLLQVSNLGLPGDWATPAIIVVVGGTMAVSGALFWLSDLVASRLIGTPDRHTVATKPLLCFLCRAELLRDAMTCPACGVLVRDQRHPRGTRPPPQAR
jgi:hypothetical protein